MKRERYCDAEIIRLEASSISRIRVPSCQFSIGKKHGQGEGDRVVDDRIPRIIILAQACIATILACIGLAKSYKSSQCELLSFVLVSWGEVESLLEGIGFRYCNIQPPNSSRSLLMRSKFRINICFTLFCSSISIVLESSSCNSDRYLGIKRKISLILSNFVLVVSANGFESHSSSARHVGLPVIRDT